MKNFVMAGLAVVALLVVAEPVMAQQSEALSKEVAGTGARLFSTPAAAAGFGAALTIIGAGIGFGRIGAAALESMARQPEVAGRIFTAMLIIGAFLEGATLFSLIICIIMAGR